MKYLWSFLLLCGILLGSSSCVSHKKTLLLKNENEVVGQTDTVALNFKKVDYKIQRGDFLDIQISSPDAEASRIFSKITTGQVGNELTPSYQVNSEGNIHLQLLGVVNVEGKNTEEIRLEISKKLEEHFKYVVVTVRLLNYQIVFIGETGSNAQVVTFYEDRINFFEALSRAGGTTVFSNTGRVKLVRRINEDNVKVVFLDISKQDFLSSEYFYLQPNDIIYIEPLRAKAIRQNLILLNTVTVITSLVVLFTRFTNP